MPPPHAASNSSLLVLSALYPESASLRRAERQRLGLERRQVEAAGGVVDIETDYLSPGVQVYIEPIRHLPCLRAWPGFEFNIEAVRFRIVMQFHSLPLFVSIAPIKKGIVDGFTILEGDNP